METRPEMTSKNNAQQKGDTSRKPHLQKEICPLGAFKMRRVFLFVNLLKSIYFPLLPPSIHQPLADFYPLFLQQNTYSVLFLCNSYSSFSSLPLQLIEECSSSLSFITLSLPLSQPSKFAAESLYTHTVPSSVLSSAPSLLYTTHSVLDSFFTVFSCSAQDGAHLLCLVSAQSTVDWMSSVQSIFCCIICISNSATPANAAADYFRLFCSRTALSFCTLHPP